MMGNEPTKDTVYRIINILTALFTSVIFIWIVGYFFCDELIYYVFDQKLKKMIHVPRLTYRHKSEGYAATYKGKYGINAIEDITLSQKDKVVIWGDSYIEAHQVDDQNKIPQLVTKRLQETRQASGMMSFGVGMSGDGVADYYFDIPKYEKLVRNIKAHYLVITSIDDVLPEQGTDRKRGVFKVKPFRLTHDNWKPKFQKEKKFLSRYGLYFIWEPVRRTITSVKKINFLPSPKKRNSRMLQSKGDPYSEQFLFEAWSFLMRNLRNQTSHPIIFVYCPSVPGINNGQIITTDKNDHQIDLFSRIAKNHGIEVINLAQGFISLYSEKGLFPRGFSNTKPGMGHFNTHGHKIVSKIITDHILSMQPAYNSKSN